MKASLASATSVVALLAVQGAQNAGVLVTVASGAAGVAAATLLDMPSASAGTITMTGTTPYFGPSATNTSVSTGVLTVFDLINGGANKTTTLLTFTAKNDQTNSRTINGATFLATAAGATGTLQGGSAGFVIAAGATGGGSVTYTYVATGATSVSSTRV